MIEEMEISIRQSLESFYMAKQRDILEKVRHSWPDRPVVSDEEEGGEQTEKK